MSDEQTYTAKALTWVFGRTGKKGTSAVEVTFEVTAGEFTGQQFRWIGFFTEKTIERTHDSLRNCGWDGVSYTSMDGMGDHDVSIVVGLEEWEGKKIAKVRWVNRLSALTPLTESELVALDERHKRLGGASQAWGPPPGGVQDDIPF